MNSQNSTQEYSLIFNDLHLVQTGKVPTFLTGEIKQNFGFQKHEGSYLYRITLESDGNELNVHLTDSRYSEGTWVSGYVDQDLINQGMLRLYNVVGHKINGSTNIIKRELTILGNRMQADFGRRQDLDIRSNPAIEELTFTKQW